MDELLKECEKSYKEKNFSRLNWACNQILEQDKSNEAALSYELYLYCDWWQYHLVFETANQIHRLYPDNYHAYNAEASAYLDKGEFEKALECCEMGLKIKDYYWLRINRIEALISLNRLDEAFEFYNASEIPDYNFTKALINCGRYSQISEYEILSKEELADCFLKRCKYLDRRGNRREILKVCDEIFKIGNDNELALEYRINSLAFLGEDEEVLKWSGYAIKLYPKNFRFYFVKAETLFWSFEDIDGAIKYYEMGFAIAEDFDRYWFDMDNLITALNKKADQLIESGNFRKAMDVYDKILFYRPKEFKAMDNIDELVKKHGIDYEYGENYKESSRLKSGKENKFGQIDDYLNAIDIGDYDSEYVNGCSEFKDYGSIDEYVRDIIICLMEAYPSYDEEDSRYLVKIAMDNVKEAFRLKEPAYDFAVVYGFSGG